MGNLSYQKELCLFTLPLKEKGLIFWPRQIWFFIYFITTILRTNQFRKKKCFFQGLENLMFKNCKRKLPRLLSFHAEAKYCGDISFKRKYSKDNWKKYFSNICEATLKMVDFFSLNCKYHFENNRKYSFPFDIFLAHKLQYRRH